MTGDAVKQTIELDEPTADRFKQYCRYEKQINQIIDSGIASVPQWAQLYDFANKLQFGSVLVTFKDSTPVRVDNPMQSIIFGINLTPKQ